MLETHKKSFISLLVLIFLLPLFFIPGGAFSLASAKSALLVLGLVVVSLVFLFEVWQAEKLVWPKSFLALTILLLPIIYLLSALLSTPSSLALFGYNFDLGTFGFILLSSLLSILVSLIFSDTSRILQILALFLLSVSLVILFLLVRILLGGDIFIWGNFFDRLSSPLGVWTDAALLSGFIALLSSLALGMIPMKLPFRIFIYISFALGLIVLLILSFSTALILSFIGAMALLFYFYRVEKFLTVSKANSETLFSSAFWSKFFPPIALGLVALVSLVNPVISSSGRHLNDILVENLKIENIDVRPSLSATLNVSKAVLSEEGFWGSGPNTFGRDWLSHRPADVNATPFWATTFPFGVGFIPTQVSATGLLGTLIWLAFFIFFLTLGFRSLFNLPTSRPQRFVLVATFLGALFLWVYSFLYTPSATVLIFAFAFTGLFLAAGRVMHLVVSEAFEFKEPRPRRYLARVLIVAIVLTLIFIAWIGFEKTASSFYFKRASDLSNTANASLVEIEGSLDKAIAFAPADIHYLALSRLNFAKAQNAASSGDSSEETQKIFEEAVRASVEAARSAVSLNPEGYQNWISLGVIYSALVPEPLSVPGAYENALLSYDEATKRNPLNPEIPLFRAQLELSRGDVDAARSFIQSSIALKEDYPDAYLVLVQLEVREGRVSEAIASAERLSALLPGNPGIYFELGLLKYSTRDYQGAVEAFNYALSVAPDYANAQYYLGLSYARLDLLDEALKQFRALVSSNPNEVSVQNILRELEEGSTSFLNGVE